jgi:hypothetical protein
VSDTKKWTAMMSRKPELDLGGQARKIENQRVQIKRLTEKNANLCRMLDDSKARIEELEAEVARLWMILASLDAYARGEPSQPPATGAEKRNIDTRKEVMPDDRPVRDRHADTGPGDQAIAGAAQKGDAP